MQSSEVPKNRFSILPKNKLWLIPIIIISLLDPLHYAILSLYPAYGYTFSGYTGDDSVFFTTMESVKWGMTNPWSPSDESIFTNPAFGPVYILVPLGFFALAVGISTVTVFVAFKFFSTLLFLLVAYHFIKRLTRHHNAAYTLFTLTAGLGGLFILFYKIATFSDIFAPTPLYGFGVAIMRIAGTYQLLPFATGLIAIMFTMDRKYVLSGILLGLTILFYPFLGATITLLLLLYHISHKSAKLSTFAKTLLIAAPFALAWILPYLLRPGSFIAYAKVGQDISGIFLPTLLLGWGLPFAFAIHFLYKDTSQRRRYFKSLIITGFWLASIALFSLSNLSRSYWATSDPAIKSLLTSSGLSFLTNALTPFALILMIPMFSLILWYSYKIYFSLSNRVHRFLFLWMAAVGLLIVAPGEIVYLFGGKIHALIWIPICILGAEGIMKFSKQYKISAKKMLWILVITSVPTLLLLNIYTQSYPRVSITSTNLERCCFFYTNEERAAYDFLSKQPRGMVLSSIEIGTALPIYSSHKALFHMYLENFVADFKKKLVDYENFYSFKTPSEIKLSILEKYNIDYVFYGSFEQRINNEGINETYLQEIFSLNNTYVYKVIRRPGDN